MSKNLNKSDTTELCCCAIKIERKMCYRFLSPKTKIVINKIAIWITAVFLDMSMIQDHHKLLALMPVSSLYPSALGPESSRLTVSSAFVLISLNICLAALTIPAQLTDIITSITGTTIFERPKN